MEATKSVAVDAKAGQIKTKQKEYSVGPKQYISYCLGNVASQLSWTMVSTYLSIFYTDVFGLMPAAVSVLFLVAKIWDGVNDPMMGTIMQKTHSKYGRFRPYIAIGAPLLILVTILTFSVPGFGSTGKLVWAYITYIALGMTYTMTNVPYQGLPGVMTRDGAKVNRLNSASTMGMMVGMTILNLVTLPLVNAVNGWHGLSGYTIVAIIYACVALPMFWICVWNCKEVVTIEKKDELSVKESIKLIFTSRNMVMAILYDMFVIMGAMGRIAIAVYFYLYVANAGSLVSIYMMMPMFMGIVLTPICPKLMDKMGKKKITLLSLVLQSIGLLMMIAGPYTNPVYLFICTAVYGLGALKEPSLPGFFVDALEEINYKTGKRPDGIAFSLMGLGNKIGSAIGSALGIAVIGAFGYYGGVEITSQIQTGIQLSVNLFPVICFAISAIPVCLYNLKEEDVAKMRKEIDARKQA